MKTLHIHNGIAYHSKDLAIINGADELSMYTVKLNDTESEDINILVDLNTVTFEDDFQNEITFQTTGGLEYMRIDTYLPICKTLQTRLENEIVNFVDGFNEEDYFNEN